MVPAIYLYVHIYIYTQCEALKIAFSWFITPITMVYGTQITIVTGANLNQLITGGPHIVYIYTFLSILDTHFVYSNLPIYIYIYKCIYTRSHPTQHFHRHVYPPRTCPAWTCSVGCPRRDNVAEISSFSRENGMKNGPFFS